MVKALDLFDNPTLAYENVDEIGIFIYNSGGLSNKSIVSVGCFVNQEEF